MPETNFASFLKNNLKVSPQKQTVLDKVLTLSGTELENKLIESGLTDEGKLTKLKADYYHLPFITLAEIEIGEGVHEIIPANLIQTYRLVPFFRDHRVVKVALAEPTNLQALEALEFLARKNDWRFQLYLVTPTDINALLKKSVGVVAEVKQAVTEFTREQTARTATRKAAAGSLESQIAEKAPVAKIVDGLIAEALVARASDIHMEPMEENLRIRFRVDGQLKDVFTLPKNAQSAVISRIKILSNMKIDEQRLPQDGRFRFTFQGDDIDFRVSTFPTTYGEKAVLRLLSKANKIPSFEELGLTSGRLKTVSKALSASHGMLLVTGPTGSGKSTTLFVALSQLNKPGVNIVTLEDPIEYILPGANQAQVNPDIGFTFAAGLRSILRQDPNIILVGEIRDRETAELAVHSALTGHLVFSTLHTNDAVGALPRLIDMGVEPFLIIASVNVIVAQRLVRMICSDCKKEVKVTDQVMGLITEELKDIPEQEIAGLDPKHPKIYAGQGCKKCGDTGYRGRLGIYEAVEVTKEIGELTLTKAAPHKLQEVAREQGSITIRQDGFIKALKGLTTIEEVLRATTEAK